MFHDYNKGLLALFQECTPMVCLDNCGTNANPPTLRIVCLFSLSLVLQGVNLRTNSFQDGEDDTRIITNMVRISPETWCVQLKYRRGPKHTKIIP